jgi:cytochrome c-type biogenesis protein CcmH/NrfG
VTKSKSNRKKKRVQKKTASLEKGYYFWDLADEYMDKGNTAKAAGAVVRAEKLLPPNPDLYKLMVSEGDRQKSAQAVPGQGPALRRSGAGQDH